MFDSDDEMEATRREAEKVLALLSDNRSELQAKGFDVDGAMVELEAQFAQLERIGARVNRAQQKFLHTCADSAEARTAFFKTLCEVLDPLVEEQPWHPVAKEWQELRRVLQQQVPKSN